MASTRVRFTRNNGIKDQVAIQDMNLQSDDYDAIETKQQIELNKTSDFETSSRQVTDKSRQSHGKVKRANPHVCFANHDAMQTKRRDKLNKKTDFGTLSKQVNNESRTFLSHRNEIGANTREQFISNNYTLNQGCVQENKVQPGKLCGCALCSLLTVVSVIVFIVYIIPSAIMSDECSPDPCVNGNCTDGLGYYSCLCNDGFVGTNCEHKDAECSSDQCVNGECFDWIDDYICLCNDGFDGTDCEHNIDDCSSDPCVNGICIDGIGNYDCVCDHGFGGTNCEHTKATDCVDILRYSGSRSDGIYTVRTWKSHRLINVYCDMTTDGGGWTVFQYRFDGSTEFYRNFYDYDAGFGKLTKEFWLGLRNIQEIAGQGQTFLRIDLEAANGTKAYETFNRFHLSPKPAYTLHLGPTTASLRISSRYSFGIHSGSDFSTYDHDADVSSDNCAVKWHGAWWYTYDCSTANLNGQYLTTGTTFHGRGMIYNNFLFNKSLKTSKMMMRRKNKL